MQTNIDDELLRGIAAARAGRRSEARALILRAVERDERNEQAWLWLAGVMDDPADVRTCLENVLALNPANARARQGLDWLTARYGASEEGRRTTDDGPRTADDGPRTTDDGPRTAPATQNSKLATEHAANRAGAAATENSKLKPENSAHAENPCPYCGAPTAERQRSCTQCQRSLMVPTPPPETPSRWLGALAGAWRACGWLLALTALAYVVAALLAYQAARYGGPGGQERPDAPFPLGLVTVAAGLLALTLGARSLVQALRRRALPAYYAAVVALPLALALVALSLLRGLPAATLAAAGLAGQPALALEIVLTALLGALLALLLLAAALAGMAYRDFFGPLVRFAAAVEPASATGHYNSGVAYKNRGMWYMAMREWERAVAGAPRDINYLRALGLAYAQLGRYGPARATIGRALALAPEHAGLLEDQALVERMRERSSG